MPKGFLQLKGLSPKKILDKVANYLASLTYMAGPNGPLVGNRDDSIEYRNQLTRYFFECACIPALTRHYPNNKRVMIERAFAKHMRSVCRKNGGVATIISAGAYGLLQEAALIAIAIANGCKKLNFVAADTQFINYYIARPIIFDARKSLYDLIDLLTRMGVEVRRSRLAIDSAQDITRINAHESARLMNDAIAEICQESFASCRVKKPLAKVILGFFGYTSAIHPDFLKNADAIVAIDFLLDQLDTMPVGNKTRLFFIEYKTDRTTWLDKVNGMYIDPKTSCTRTSVESFLDNPPTSSCRQAKQRPIAVFPEPKVTTVPEKPLEKQSPAGPMPKPDSQAITPFTIVNTTEAFAITALPRLINDIMLAKGYSPVQAAICIEIVKLAYLFFRFGYLSLITPAALLLLSCLRRYSTLISAVPTILFVSLLGAQVIQFGIAALVPLLMTLAFNCLIGFIGAISSSYFSRHIGLTQPDSKKKITKQQVTNMFQNRYLRRYRFDKKAKTKIRRKLVGKTGSTDIIAEKIYSLSSYKNGCMGFFRDVVGRSVRVDLQQDSLKQIHA